MQCEILAADVALTSSSLAKLCSTTAPRGEYERVNAIEHASVAGDGFGAIDVNYTPSLDFSGSSRTRVRLGSTVTKAPASKSGAA